MVTSNSRIMDMPTFPDDLVPKLFTGTEMKLGWFPYIHGICIDNRGKPVYILISIDFSPKSTLGGTKFIFEMQGKRFAGYFDKSVLSYAGGILTLGTTPKLTLDYHHPHRARVDINSKISVELCVTYRGPPLWYSKSTTTSEMFDFTRSTFVGGYDAPCKIYGKTSLAKKSFFFSGYGDYEHVWLLGSFNWQEAISRWLIFNDSHFYGVATKTYDINTEAILGSTGRFGIENGSAFILDDFEWADDDRQPPKFVSIKGHIKDINGNVKSSINIASVKSVNLIIPSIYTQHKMVGTVFGETFDGSAWCETHKPFGTPKPQYSFFDRPTKLFKVIRK